MKTISQKIFNFGGLGSKVNAIVKAHPSDFVNVILWSHCPELTNAILGVKRTRSSWVHTRNTEKSVSSTNGTPPNWTPLSTVLSVELKQLLLSAWPEELFETRNHHGEVIVGVEARVCLQKNDNNIF